MDASNALTLCMTDEDESSLAHPSKPREIRPDHELSKVEMVWRLVTKANAWDAPPASSSRAQNQDQTHTHMNTSSGSSSRSRSSSSTEAETKPASVSVVSPSVSDSLAGAEAEAGAASDDACSSIEETASAEESTAHDDEDASECASVQEQDHDQEHDYEHDASASARPHRSQSNQSQSHARRKRKRTRRYVFSAARARNRASASTGALNPSHAMPPLLSHGAATAEPQGEVVAWDWSACEGCFEPIRMEQLAALERVRHACADVVASNPTACACNRRMLVDTATLTAIGEDAEDKHALPVRRQRRGRWYRDVWEEEDFLMAQHKQQVESGAGKTIAFAEADVLKSNAELVHDYDDERFRAFVERLEVATANAVVIGHMKARAKTTQKENQSVEMVPVIDDDIAGSTLVPVDEWHPAACGLWRIPEKHIPASFDEIHPASLRPSNNSDRPETNPQQEEDTSILRRLRKPRSCDPPHQEDATGNAESTPAESSLDAELQNDEDATASHDTFGNAKEEDEISRELDAACLRLVELSALNWRQTQTLFERACCQMQTAPLLQAEEASHRRLEELYSTMYSCGVSQDHADRVEDGRVPSRPRHLVEYAKSHCAEPTEAIAVSASVEYAMRLQRGDEVDVLDANRCWNDGVVVDLYMEGAKSLKFVLVSFSFWSDTTVEWIPVTAGRLLPRGVADGRATFVVAKTSVRNYRMKLDKTVADLLEQTYPARRRRSEEQTIRCRQEVNLPETKVKHALKKRRKT